jgi:repressor LexA
MPFTLQTDLTPAHRRIAMSVWKRTRNGGAALVAEIVRELDYATEGGLTPTLKIMERNGFLEIRGGGARGRPRVLALTDKAREAIGEQGIPLLGSIPAGRLSEAIQEADQFVDERSLLAWRKGDFLLRVRGDSMIGDGILEGDKVLLRPDVELRSGEIAAVETGDSHEATLKRVITTFLPEKVILRASNPAYEDKEVTGGEFRISGVFRGLIREVR